jgi:hypothetical protein
VSPVRYERGFYIPEDDILHSDRRENLKSYSLVEVPTQFRGKYWSSHKCGSVAKQEELRKRRLVTVQEARRNAPEDRRQKAAAGENVSESVE